MAEAVKSVFLPKLGKTVKLGAIRPKVRPQVLRFASYLMGAPTPPPLPIDYYSPARASLGRMYRNDALGCCVISGKLHNLGVWSANDKAPVILAQDSEVDSQYHAICGPGDNGCVISVVLDTFKTKGLKANGVVHKIDGYVAVDNTSKIETMIALYLFGALTIGFDLPQKWYQDAEEMAVWDVTNTGIVGGHDVSAVGCDDKYVYLSTWGVVVRMTWAAWTSRTWLTECYAMLSPDWTGSDKVNAATGFDATTLAADLAKLSQGVVPDVGPVPVVPPVVPPVDPPVVPPVDPPPVVPPVEIPPQRVTVGGPIAIPPLTVYVQGPLGRMLVGQTAAAVITGNTFEGQTDGPAEIHRRAPEAATPDGPADLMELVAKLGAGGPVSGIDPAVWNLLFQALMTWLQTRGS